MLITLYLLRQPGPSSSGSDKEKESSVTEHSSPTSPTRRKNHEPNGVTMATGLIPWEDESIHQVGFVTGKHGRKSQSPDLSPGKSRAEWTGSMVMLGSSVLSTDRKSNYSRVTPLRIICPLQSHKIGLTPEGGLNYQRK